MLTPLNIKYHISMHCGKPVNYFSLILVALSVL